MSSEMLVGVDSWGIDKRGEKVCRQYWIVITPRLSVRSFTTRAQAAARYPGAILMAGSISKSSWSKQYEILGGFGPYQKAVIKALSKSRNWRLQ